MVQQVRYLRFLMFLGLLSCSGMVLWASTTSPGGKYTFYDPNELVWGPVYRGLALSICPIQSQYTLGEDIKIQIYLKNLRSEEFLMMYNRYKRLYRMALFDSEGAPVERAEDIRNSEVSEIKPEQLLERFSKRDIRVPPWKESTQKDAHRVVNLNAWFKIEKPGTYTLIVMHPIASRGMMEGPSWEDGFLISNEIKINIVEN